MVYLILALYLVLTFGSSLIGLQTKGQTPESYFLAGRNLSSWVLFFTLAATTFSAFFFLGFAGDGYRTGYSFYVFMAFGTALAAVSFYLIGDKAWKAGKQKGYITPVEMIGDISGSKPLKNTYLIIFLIFTLPYVALQPIGAGYIMEELTNGQVPFIWGASALTFVIILYVLVGGMKSVAFTDVKQGILMIVLMGAALWVVADQLGGLTNANERVFEQHPELFSREGAGGFFTWEKWFSMCLLWFCCLPMFPHIFMRFFIGRDLNSFKTSTVLYALIPAFLFLIPVTIGVLGHLDFPGLEGNEADRILPMMLNLHAPKWFAALIMTGALAAFMSTLDSQLLALGTLFTRDIYLPLNPKASMKDQVRVGKIAIAVFALLGLVIAAQPFDSLFVIGQQTFFGLAVLFPPTLALFYFRKVNPIACLVAILFGESLVVASYFQWIPEWLFLGFTPYFPVLITEFMIIVLGSWRR